MFRNSPSALQWAFRTSGRPIVKLSSINTMMGSMSRGSGENLTPQERHAEAAFIYLAAGRACDVYEIAYLNAQYGAQLHHGDAEKAVMKILMQLSMGALPTGNHRRRGVELIIRNYFSYDFKRSVICRKLDCTVRRYYEYREIIYQALENVSYRAEAAAAQALESAGLVAPADYFE